jgi:hypothetical protein
MFLIGGRWSDPTTLGRTRELSFRDPTSCRKLVSNNLNKTANPYREDYIY